MGFLSLVEDTSAWFHTDSKYKKKLYDHDDFLNANIYLNGISIYKMYYHGAWKLNGNRFKLQNLCNSKMSYFCLIKFDMNKVNLSSICLSFSP